jgi:diguanylate cyclase (GGDEF)-like protein
VVKFVLDKQRQLKMEKERVLEIVSNETKDEICKLDVVTPEIFADVFLDKIKKYDIKNYEEFVDKYINDKVNNFLQIQNETSQKANQLSKTTSKAIEAISEKNDDSLKQVLVETSKLKQEIEKLKESLYKDELTGAYNRKWIYDNLVKEDTNNFLKSGVLALIDLNYFKTINDTFGHIIGDKVLKFVATQLKKSKANVVRYGGDEFLVIFDDKSDVDEVRKKLKILREQLLKKHLKAKEAEFRVSFSIGATDFKEDDIVEDVVDKADKDMYDDKISIKKTVKGIEV